MVSSCPGRKTACRRSRSVSKQSPAASAGVQKGDIVVSLDGTEVTADSYDTVAEKLGVTTSGDKVLIGLRRGDSELSVDLTSSSFDVVTVEGRMVGDIAVIRIAAFTGNHTGTV